MRVTVNGKTQEIPAGTTLKGLLEMTGKSKYVAVALNMEFVPQSEYERNLLRAGDEVEIVSPQAGG
ncbi:MAG: sulfur carrier protein ThiS [Nitrospinae bacterium]|nr:sulfur carrier protein ThiS [Nitrospinota bacterium]